MSIDQAVENVGIIDRKTPPVTVIIAASAIVDTSGIVNSFRSWEEKNKTERKLIIGGSFGYYELEPVVIIRKTDLFTLLYRNVTENIASELVRDSLDGDDPRPDLAYCNLGSEEIKSVPFSSSIRLFNMQQRIALRNCGFVDPRDIDCYIAERQGYTGLARVLRMNRREALEELLSLGNDMSDLAGRWLSVHNVQGTDKYVAVKFFDVEAQRQTAGLLLQGDPHSVLEGSLIAAYIVGASRCIIAAPLNDAAVGRLEDVVKQMSKKNLAGGRILDSEFSCDIEIRKVLPSLILGDETALLAMLEGRQAMPSQRDIHSLLVLEQKPVLIEDAETLSKVSAMFQKRAEWFFNADPFSNIGSRVTGLSGAGQHGCALEVPTEMTLRNILVSAGAVSNHVSFKAVLFGGPTGVFISPDGLDVTLGELSHKGSTIDVVPDDACIVGYTAHAVSDVQKQSCGECVFCREGMLQISAILQDIIQGESNDGDLEIIMELAEAMKAFSSCAVGSNAADMILSSLKLFRDEYELHMRGMPCGQHTPGSA